MSARAYLDHNATSPLRPQAAEAVARALSLPGNPSSVHQEGRAARALIEEAREQLAALVGARPRDVVFTSGGTEGAAMALRPCLTREPGLPVSLLLHSAAEHVCVRDGHGFAADAVDIIPVDGDGLVDLGGLEARLTRHADERKGAALVSVQAANNETGVLQPLGAIGALVRKSGGVFHCDAVQALGRIQLDYRGAGVDLLTLSGHKLGGPKGAGALVVCDETLRFTTKFLRGGGQERGQRAGTENVPGIAGFGAAAQAVRQGLRDEMARVQALRDRFEAGLLAVEPGVTIFGRKAARLGNTSAFALAGVSAEKALIRFDLGGVALSSGSACSSGKVARSHVLAAMGVADELSACALRASFGWSSREEDVDSALAVVARLVEMRERDVRAVA